MTIARNYQQRAIKSSIRKPKRIENETQWQYLKRAAKHARRLVNKWKNQFDYKHCHESFLIRDVLLAIESAYELNTFGVEYIGDDIQYLNTGDSYGLTILYVKGKFCAATWGDIVESGKYN